MLRPSQIELDWIRRRTKGALKSMKFADFGKNSDDSRTGFVKLPVLFLVLCLLAEFLRTRRNPQNENCT